MNLSAIFMAAAAGVAGAAVATTLGLPAAGIAVTASAAALGAGATSALIWKGVETAYNGKGAEGAIIGLFLAAAGHVTAVPAASVGLAYGVLKLTGFVP